MVSALCKWLVANWLDCWENRRPRRGAFGHVFVEAGQSDQQQRARRSQHAEPDIEQIDDKQIDRKPRRIEEGEQRRAGNELANVGQVAQRLPGVAFALEQIALECGLVDAQIEAALQLAADADDDKAADHFQQADKGEEADHHQRQHCQSSFVLR